MSLSKQKSFRMKEDREMTVVSSNCRREEKKQQGSIVLCFFMLLNAAKDLLAFLQVNILLTLVLGQLCVCLFPVSKSNSNLHSCTHLCSSHEPIKDTYSSCSLYNLFHLWEDCAPVAHPAWAHFTVWQIASTNTHEAWKKQQHSSRLNWSKTSKNQTKQHTTSGDPDRKCQATRQAIKRAGLTQHFNIPSCVHLWKCHCCIWAQCDREAPAWL